MSELHFIELFSILHISHSYISAYWPQYHYKHSSRGGFRHVTPNWGHKKRPHRPENVGQHVTLSDLWASLFGVLQHYKVRLVQHDSGLYNTSEFRKPYLNSRKTAYSCNAEFTESFWTLMLETLCEGPTFLPNMAYQV